MGFLFPTGGVLVHGPASTCASAVQRNPCRHALISTLSAWQQDPANGRASWDAIVTLAAVRGVESIGGHKAGYGGVNVVDRGGTNHWRPGTGSRQSYLALRGDKHWREIDADIAAGRPPPILDEMRDEIDRLLCITPK